MFKNITILFVIISMGISGLALSQEENTTTPAESAPTPAVPEVVDVDIKDVVTDPGFYNNKQVSLEGQVRKVKYTTSSKGRPYTIFKIRDANKNTVGVYYKGEHLQITKGDMVRVTGKFKKKKKYSIFTFRNVIKAKKVAEI